jgi:pimeloyl-ACP methyl ester carboxylesterase
MERIAYDEFSMFRDNAEEFGIPYDRPPRVRREFVEVEPGRRLSALVWGDGDPELVFLHGGAQNAHTWDTVALALDRPLVAIDLPGHGHSDGGKAGSLGLADNAADVAVVIRALARNAKAVVGMSLGGMTTIALADHAPELVRKVVLVDVTPGVNAEKSKLIGEFISGPESFDSFDELLERTMKYNPTRTESSLRRGILHNAEQREDGTWVWRYARFRAQEPSLRENADPAEAQQPGFTPLWDAVGRIQVPLLLARGMREQSVVGDEDEVELLRRLPDAEIEHFEEAGHSLQGDTPVELARSIERFALESR